MTTLKNSTGVIHDVEQITPYIGMTGLYVLREPYNNLIKPNIEYTCISVTNISGAIANNVNVKDDIYIGNGDTEENYDRDYLNNTTLVSLQSSRGDIIIVPSTAIIGLPNANGVNYISVLLGVSLSVIPETTDLTDIIDRIKDLIQKDLGVRSEVYPTVLGGSLLIDFNKHEQIETAREALIDESSNALIELETLRTTNAAQQQKIQLLENYIRINLPPV